MVCMVKYIALVSLVVYQAKVVKVGAVISFLAVMSTSWIVWTTTEQVDFTLLDLGRAPYVLYGVKYIGLVSPRYPGPAEIKMLFWGQAG